MTNLVFRHQHQCNKCSADVPTLKAELIRDLVRPSPRKFNFDEPGAASNCKPEEETQRRRDKECWKTTCMAATHYNIYNFH